VLLELFTSEGCSSCPPADALLAELAGRPEPSGSRMYALAFHVDYWNHLGWRDPFSDAAYSARQRSYAPAANGVYTPELVVSGIESFVGSDRTRALRAIARAREASWSARIALTSNHAGRIGYAVTGAPRGVHLNLALVQPRAASQVAAGENSGRVLPHVNVVREFLQTELGSSGRGEWSPRFAERGTEPFVVVAYAQDDATRAVVGANSVRARCEARAPD
jgi:hypothetical protein